MNEIAELERRIAAALDRIGHGAEGLAGEAPAGAGEGAPGAELAQARRDLAAERARSGEALAAAAELERRLRSVNAQMAAQAGEIQRLKAVAEELAATVQALREAEEDGADASLLDRARLAELEALRAARRAEMVEIDGLLAELRPLIGEAHHA